MGVRGEPSGSAQGRSGGQAGDHFWGDTPSNPRLWTWGARGVGLLLLVLALTPIYRLMGTPDAGGFGGAALLRGSADLVSTWWGLLTTLVLGGALAILMPTQKARRYLRRLGEGLSVGSAYSFAATMAVVAAGLALFSSLVLFKGYPTLLDGMVNLLQSRVLAAGQAALDLPEPTAAWMIQNTVLTQQGWVSQYPPFPAFLLAIGQLIRAPWLVYPLLLGASVFFTILLGHLLLPGRVMALRLGGVLLALCPFLVFLGGGYLSHIPAAAFGALTLFAAVRALRGSWSWALLVGVGSGATVASRPLFGLAIGVLLPALLWLSRAKGQGFSWIGSRLGAATAGGIPFALSWGLYNNHFFGHPLDLGYSAAFGPAHGLGFHPDPWGNSYGLAEAVGSTAGDLMSLGVFLFETPFSAVVLVGVFLLRKPCLSRGGLLFLAWALLPFLANALYWHHGFHLGPRMLYEAAPAWVFLSALAALGLSERQDGASDLRSRLNAPDILLWTFVVSAIGAAILIPSRAASYQWPEETLDRIAIPSPPETEPALVFVHGSWNERVAARLQGSGMRLDSVETVLRRNDLCQVHHLASRRLAVAGTGEGIDSSADLDFQLLPGTPPHLREVRLSEEHRALDDPESEPTPDCRLEARADRNGIISLAPLLWQGDLPGFERGDPMFVRDLGWADNGAVQAAFPHRKPYLFLIPAPGKGPELWDYDEGMELIWGEERSN